MIYKVLGWLLVAWVAVWLLSQFLIFLPLLLKVTGGLIAACTVYSLLPEGFRVMAIENWLDERVSSPFPSPSKESYSPSTSSSFSIGTDYQDRPNENEQSQQPFLPPRPAPQPMAQPKLDFEKIKRRTTKLPDRQQLTEHIKSQVIGQDSASEALVKVVLGKLAMQQNASKPLVLLLPGPTGTGKTEISKTLASGLGTNLVRFDMNGYMDRFKATNLLGSSKGYVGGEDGGALPNALRQAKNPCVILFDEVEKADDSIWPEFLTFFDEGYITDSIGKAVAPKDTIILMTSNLASEEIAANPDRAKTIIKQTKVFSPEFLGRVDKVIPLLQLNPADVARLTVVLAKRIAEGYGLSLLIEQGPLEVLVSEVMEFAEKEGGRGITNQTKELLSEDLMDLQAERVKQAQLVLEDECLRVVPLVETEV
jgi:ATP-dependent Clp protease ATP-binding subunit ClpA